jgi:hypothetical protein
MQFLLSHPCFDLMPLYIDVRTATVLHVLDVDAQNSVRINWAQHVARSVDARNACSNISQVSRNEETALDTYVYTEG